jgi:hypothetical protein
MRPMPSAVSEQGNRRSGPGFGRSRMPRQVTCYFRAHCPMAGLLLGQNHLCVFLVESHSLCEQTGEPGLCDMSGSSVAVTKGARLRPLVRPMGPGWTGSAAERLRAGDHQGGRDLREGGPNLRGMSMVSRVRQGPMDRERCMRREVQSTRTLDPGQVRFSQGRVRQGQATESKTPDPPGARRSGARRVSVGQQQAEGRSRRC